MIRLIRLHVDMMGPMTQRKMCLFFSSRAGPASFEGSFPTASGVLAQRRARRSMSRFQFLRSEVLKTSYTGTSQSRLQSGVAHSHGNTLIFISDKADSLTEPSFGSAAPSFTNERVGPSSTIDEVLSRVRLLLYVTFGRFNCVPGSRGRFSSQVGMVD